MPYEELVMSASENLDRLEDSVERISTLIEGIQEKLHVVAQLEELVKSSRARVHNLNDEMQKVAGKYVELSVLVSVLKEQIMTLQQNTVTRDHLQSSIENITQKIGHVQADLEPIKRGIYWVILLVLGAVITAVLGLVLINKGELVKHGAQNRMETVAVESRTGEV